MHYENGNLFLFINHEKMDQPQIFYLTPNFGKMTTRFSFFQKSSKYLNNLT